MNFSRMSPKHPPNMSMKCVAGAKKQTTPHLKTNKKTNAKTRVPCLIRGRRGVAAVVLCACVIMRVCGSGDGCEGRRMLLATPRNRIPSRRNQHAYAQPTNV